MSKKLSLNNLEIKSFTTQLIKEDGATVVGAGSRYACTDRCTVEVINIGGVYICI